jgi:hypothetical protein
MPGYRLRGVTGAAGREPAVIAEKRAQQKLIRSYQCLQQFFHVIPGRKFAGRRPALAVRAKLGYNTAIFLVRVDCPDFNKTRKNI